jgi:S1-C subfamily serine protease
MIGKIIRAVMLLAVLGAFLSIAPAASAADPQEVYAFVNPTIAYITMSERYGVYDSYNDNWLDIGGEGDEVVDSGGSCTGFVVNPNGYIATAAHCVDPKYHAAAAFFRAVDWAIEQKYYDAVEKTEEFAKEDWEVYELDSEGSKVGEAGSITVSATVHMPGFGARTGEGIPAEIVDFDTTLGGNDIALLKIDQQNLPSLLLSTETPALGSAATSVGYAGIVDDTTDMSSYNPSFKTGTISSSKDDQDGNPVYEISAAVQHGMSGGPTVNDEGEAIGVNSFGASDVGDNQGFNFIRPSTIFLEMMRRNNVTNELAAGQEAPGSSSSKLPFIIAGVVVVLIVLGVVLFLRRRNGKPHDPTPVAEPVMETPEPVQMPESPRPVDPDSAYNRAPATEVNLGEIGRPDEGSGSGADSP